MLLRPIPVQRSARIDFARHHFRGCQGNVQASGRALLSRRAWQVGAGPEVLDCLRLQVRREGETLAAVYRARISYLASSPDQASRLRAAQKAWLQFRDENCEFIRSVAPRRSADESFYDCVLKTTIDRRVELRRSVGD